MARVLVIVPFPMDADNLEKRKAQLSAVKLGPDIAFDFKPVRIAPVNYVSQQDSVLADVGMLEAGLQAEADGYDAVCIDTVSDSGMAQLRSVLNIPVIGAGRHAMLTALMLGDRFSVLAMWDRWRHLYAKTLAELGLGAKCASVRSAGLQPNNQSLLAGKEDEFFPALYEAAMRCVEEDGADVIILGSTTMHEAHAYLAERLPVPIINPGPLTYRLAETAIRLKLSHSRLTFPSPVTPATARLAAMGDAAATV
ncbi:MULTISPECIES: aspartate/glutamate racemase family protein [unclassified Chelatococcus]|uniref:aspartate/glutamate racemase family protein n=1 Tax=unclassified Chelatococcus TaxID=2638111 RepID=UPI001BCD190A|nr:MULTISPECIES: aspartate/glutamate racemase family protein [unclassified Chelatococcus]CAH1652534.1 Hydantoin racemase [Hyphomicrobiales bacterium]MBS7739997.1 hydrogenase expression protein HupH [Chelatococcus sp. HY11]MBX3546994.1 hydrogenase expression protein HupH [Chelatococcus sp.]MCO5078703.1 aspartate/glutamate racemase family protein [Chelatococcus sp.]CAH1685962.1 Hydantoin racemase [Hyphomicrobiales bacterium]